MLRGHGEKKNSVIISYQNCFCADIVFCFTDKTTDDPGEDSTNDGTNNQKLDEDNPLVTHFVQPSKTIQGKLRISTVGPGENLGRFYK